MPGTVPGMLYLDASGAQNGRPGLEREELTVSGTRSQRLHLESGEGEPSNGFPQK